MNKKQTVKDGEKYTLEQSATLGLPMMTLKEYTNEQKKYDNEEKLFVSQATWMKHVEWKRIPKQVLVNYGDSGYEVKTLWRCTCKMSDILHTQKNLENIFKYEETFANMYQDEFSHRNMWSTDQPYKEKEDLNIIYCWFRQTFVDKNDEMTKAWCPRAEINDTVIKHFKTHLKNPVKEFISGLEWDGEERLETFMQKYYGAADTGLNRVYFKRWMIALVKRIFKPGSKFDQVLVLRGEQGTWKTTLFHWLGEVDGYKRWNDMPRDVTDEIQTVYATRGKFILLCDDFDQLCKKDEIGVLKKFTSRDKITAALKFKDEEEFCATYVIAATTNQDEFLVDDKTLDERRFWIIKVNPHQLKFDLPDELRKQLFAEAYYWYMQDPDQHLWIDEKALIDEEIELQKSFKQAASDPAGDRYYELFNTEFDNFDGRFKSENEFRNAVVNTLGWTIRDFTPEMSPITMGKNKKTSKIKELPISWLHNLSCLEKRTGPRIVQILHTNGFKVEIKTVRYLGGKPTKCIKID